MYFGESENQGLVAQVVEVDLYFLVGTGGVDAGDNTLPEALMLDRHAHDDLVGAVGGEFAARNREGGA